MRLEAIGVKGIKKVGSVSKGSKSEKISKVGIAKVNVRRGRNDRGLDRAARYSAQWGNASLRLAIDRFAPRSKGIRASKGKVIYKNGETGIQGVVDNAGNHFRIEDTNITGKRCHLSLNGNIPNSKIIDGKNFWKEHFRVRTGNAF